MRLVSRFVTTYERAVLDTEGRIVLMPEVETEHDYPDEPETVTLQCRDCHEVLVDEDEDALSLIKVTQLVKTEDAA